MAVYQRIGLTELHFLLLLLVVKEGFSEDTGHRFVVSFPSGNEQWHYQPFLVAIPIEKSKINITARMPIRSDLLQPIIRTATDGQPATILLPGNFQGPRSYSLVSNGIDVYSTADIGLYVSNGVSGYFAQPKAWAGDTYRVTSSTPPPGYRTALAIIGINNNNVTVTIPPGRQKVTLNGVSYNQGDIFRVSFRAYNSVRIESEDDLTGLLVHGSMPFWITSGLALTSCLCAKTRTKPCEEFYVQPLLRTRRWGHFFATLSYSDEGDTVRITADENDAVVTMMTSRNTTTFKLSEGGFVDVRLSGGVENDFTSFSATRRVHLQQFVQADSSDKQYPWRQRIRLTVPHIGEYTKRQAFYIDDDSTNRSYIFHVTFYSGPADGLTLDGSAIKPDSRHFGDGTRNWQYVVFEATLSRGVHVLGHNSGIFGAVMSDGVVVQTTTEQPAYMTTITPDTETTVAAAVAYPSKDDSINLHAAGDRPPSDNTGITRTVIAVIVSLSSAVFLVVVCILGFLAAECFGRSERFGRAKVTPWLGDSPPHE